MKVLVTGGAGYIGSVLVRMLLEGGYDVVVLDRLFFGDAPIKDIEDRIELIKDDIRSFEPSLLDKVDVVLDLASLSNDPSGELDPQKTLEINYLSRARVATLAKKHGVRRYVLASTCSVYGFREGVVDRSFVPQPVDDLCEGKCDGATYLNREVEALSDLLFSMGLDERGVKKVLSEIAGLSEEREGIPMSCLERLIDRNKSVYGEALVPILWLDEASAVGRYRDVDLFIP